MTFTPSKYQAAFLDWLRTGQGSCVLDAKAGSGKTTTLMEGIDVLDPKLSVRVLMFNTANAKDANEKLARMRADRNKAYGNVRISTFHALGYGALRQWAERNGVRLLDPSGRKIGDQIKTTWPEDQQAVYGDFCRKLVSFAKAVGIGPLQPDTTANWQALIDHHGIYLEDEGDDITEDRAIALAQALLHDSNTALHLGVIDFDDMLYLPLVLRLRLWQNDVVMVDEAQDTNPVRRALARLALKPGGRLVAVGDPHQAIYGFTGASHDAIDQIKEQFNAIQLPLSVCYRCSKEVVRRAQTIVPTIEYHDAAPEGAVEAMHTQDVLERLDAHDAVLCRNTAPLIQLAFQLIGQGRACTVLGREIGEGLISLVKKQKSKSVDTMLKKLRLWGDKQVARFTAKGEEGKAEGVTDRIACIEAVVEHLAERERTIVGLVNRLETMFSDDNGKLILSTAHKAKGREWPNVAILRPDLMPSPWARQDWQQMQESNLTYVAITRAQKNLYFMNDSIARVKPNEQARKEQDKRRMGEAAGARPGAICSLP